MSEFNTGNNTYESGKFIPIYHKYYKEDDPQKLTPRELQTLIYLRDNLTTLHNVVNTNYLILSQILSFTKYKQASKNLTIVREIMQSLKVKGVISYTEPVDRNSLFTVSVEEVKHNKDDKRTAYQAVPSDIIELTNDPYELYALITVRRFNLMDKSGEYSYPYFRNKKKWGSLLDCDDRTAYKIVEGMIEKKLLYWYENDKSYEDGNWSQCNGKYYIYPQEKEEERIRLRDEKRTEWKVKKEQSEPWSKENPF